jgi:hypothetical protein
MKYILIILLFLLLFRWIAGFLLPIFRITNATSERMRQMQDQMREMDKKMNEANKKKNIKKDGDYIDYEELN